MREHCGLPIAECGLKTEARQVADALAALEATGCHALSRDQRSAILKSAIRNPQSAIVLRRRRGAVLILVLWAIIILSLLTSGISMVVREDLVIGGISQDRLIAHWAARAGVERGIASVMDDAIDSTLDSESDLWSNNEPIFKQIQVGSGAFSLIQERYEDAPLDWFGATDESAKLNVNVATREQLMKLPKMTAPVAAAIIDWRDGDENPESDGIERGHYAALAHPYVIRNGPLRTIRELMCVRGVTPELFYGEDANANGRLDPNEDDGDATPPMDNGDGRLERGWFAYLTPYSFDRNVNALGEDRLNLKTADASTLASRLNLEQWAAQSIVNRRNQSEFRHIVDLLNVPLDATVNRGSTSDDIQSRGDDEKNQPVTQSILKNIIDDLTLSDDRVLQGRVNINTAPEAVLRTLMDNDLADAVVRYRQGGSVFGTIADLLDISGMTTEKFGELENSVTVRSSTFRILSQGEAASGLAIETIECVVDRSQATPRILYWRESGAG